MSLAFWWVIRWIVISALRKYSQVNYRRVTISSNFTRAALLQILLFLLLLLVFPFAPSYPPFPAWLPPRLRRSPKLALALFATCSTVNASSFARTHPPPASIRLSLLSSISSPRNPSYATKSFLYTFAHCLWYQNDSILFRTLCARSTRYIDHKTPYLCIFIIRIWIATNTMHC